MTGGHELIRVGQRLWNARSQAGVWTTTVVVAGLSLHRERELLVKAGLRPTEALTAATATAADAFRLAVRGRILAGRRADLVMVRGDPTTDITATRDIMRM
jgi:imidazolonepropionase-like amidohydrolase